MTQTNTNQENIKNQDFDQNEEKDPRNDLDGISLLATLFWLALAMVGFLYALRNFIQNLPNYS